MPTTLAALAVIVFAILPGIPAHSLYRTFIGIDWRETEWERAVRIIIFSLIGLMIYVVVSSITPLPLPIYVIPTTFEASSFGISSLVPIALSLFGHSISSLAVAMLAVLGGRLLSRWTPMSSYPSVWDDFVRIDVPKHWVVVRLTSGETFAGILRHADVSVCQAERDILLAEPAQYSESDKNYRVLPYSRLFLPASLICSVALCPNPDDQERITMIGSNLFHEEKTNA